MLIAEATLNARALLNISIQLERAPSAPVKPTRRQHV